MASDTAITFWGFSHLVGKTVQACVGGLDCGDHVVDTDGSITVNLETDNELLTASYLQSLDGFEGEQAVSVSMTIDGTPTTITIPVVIGIGYTSRGQLLRPEVQADVRSPTGSGLGKKRRTHQYAALLSNTGVGAVSVGTDFDRTLYDISFKDETETTVPATELISGVYWSSNIDDSYSFDSMLGWEITRPLPATVCAVQQFIETSEQ